MSPIVDPNKLKEVAQTAVSSLQASNAAYRSQERAKQRATRESAKTRAEEIIASIPEELEKAAKDLKRIPSNRKIVARIPIVEEKLRSIMASEGHLDSADKAVLEVVKKILETLSIPGVDKITIQEKTELDGHDAADGDRTYGLCKHYYLAVEVTLPK
jgi:hypothetical protein